MSYLNSTQKDTHISDCTCGFKGEHQRITDFMEDCDKTTQSSIKKEYCKGLGGATRVTPAIDRKQSKLVCMTQMKQMVNIQIAHIRSCHNRSCKLDFCIKIKGMLKHYRTCKERQNKRSCAVCKHVTRFFNFARVPVTVQTLARNNISDGTATNQP